MESTRARAQAMVVRGGLCIISMCFFHGLLAADLPNCSFPAVYSFGDSLSDNGNANVAFPEQFRDASSWPNGILAPRYPYGRYCDGWLLTDYIAFAVGARPNSPILESIAGDFTYGANFAMAGATARNNSMWIHNSGFNTPISLNMQVSWLQRYKVRLQFASQRNINQPLLTVESLSLSLYVVNAGFQDYVSILNDRTLTPLEAHDQALQIVPSVVDAIIEAVQRIYDFGAKHTLIVNLPPLGCAPSLLTTYYQDSASKYDGYGYLKNTNRISKYHNTLLEDSVDDLRDYVRDANIYFADIYRVHKEVLRMPSGYVRNRNALCEITFRHCKSSKSLLRIWCNYNFNNQTTCGHVGTYNGITISLRRPCLFPTAFANWDGIHPSARMNLVVATAIFSGEHMKTEGRLPVHA